MTFGSGLAVIFGSGVQALQRAATGAPLRGQPSRRASGGGAVSTNPPPPPPPRCELCPQPTAAASTPRAPSPNHNANRACLMASSLTGLLTREGFPFVEPSSWQDVVAPAPSGAW